MRSWRNFWVLGLAFLAGSATMSLFRATDTSLSGLESLAVTQDVQLTAVPATPSPLAGDRVDGRVKPVALSLPAAKPGDWPMWGGSPARNNVPTASDAPLEWNVGKFDRKTGEWIRQDAKNIKWVAAVGSVTYGNPVVADGRVYVGTNNGSGYLKRFPADVDLGCLLCFDEQTGQFLWQHSSEKLKSGREHDWPLQGLCCAPMVEGQRLWFVTNRGEVVCCDTEGFRDHENDGPYDKEEFTDEQEADVVWKIDMMGPPLGISQHNMCSCSVTAWGDILLVNTSNGVDESHIDLPKPDAPSFLALDKNTGEILWTDRSPGTNILHGQWSSPAVADLGGVVQAIFAGGDGWVYSFRCDRGDAGRPELLWKFDANPKTSEWLMGGRGTRNNIIATPVVYEGMVYVAMGQDPEHGEGQGHLWCIDPHKRGDVSPELAVLATDPNTPIPHRRTKAVDETKGERAVSNPNSAVIWHYAQYDLDGDGAIAFEETMHRSCGTVAIKDDLLFISDFSGVFHCLDAKTGKVHWTHDMFSAAWGSPLIVGNHVMVGDEDGKLSIFELRAEKHDPIAEIDLGNSIYTTPIMANGVLFIATKTHLFAITNDLQGP